LIHGYVISCIPFYICSSIPNIEMLYMYSVY
jgi:hypothetical protein